MTTVGDYLCRTCGRIINRPGDCVLCILCYNIPLEEAIPLDEDEIVDCVISLWEKLAAKGSAKRICMYCGEPIGEQEDPVLPGRTFTADHDDCFI